ncbi:hypothetical protein D9M68_929340 [compost metagenome]
MYSWQASLRCWSTWLIIKTGKDCKRVLSHFNYSITMTRQIPLAILGLDTRSYPSPHMLQCRKGGLRVHHIGHGLKGRNPYCAVDIDTKLDTIANFSK